MQGDDDVPARGGGLVQVRGTLLARGGEEHGVSAPGDQGGLHQDTSPGCQVL